MIQTRDYPLSCNGVRLDDSPESFGPLNTSSHLLGNPQALKEQLNHDGYLFLQDFLSRPAVEAVRNEILQQLSDEGALDPDYPISEGIARTEADLAFRPDLANGNPHIHELLYSGPLIQLFTDMLGGPIRHFDYTWFRAVTPGKATWPHCDLVYMGRGTRQLYTVWVPYGDTPIEVGGLTILEGSHFKSERIRNYLERDVDTYCTNKPERKSDLPNQWSFDGVLSKQPDMLPAKLGGRWLTSDYRMGDVIIFPMCTVHASLDNYTKRIRLSSDSRYQLASEPADERWVGAEPPGHGPHVHKGVIC